ncbi:hypothetical protein [Aquibium sp. ELW1220]|uniref:hypothetical protein n=1 Tax=Aquibium sp. ELW1220 TaxID=2976766 RepID=UPI0025B09981|nr:hypothetical protein [Aquibium sp. ELW1220]MDN2583397.1 hypothetical protein [Aquibium sp. ELW1220]
MTIKLNDLNRWCWLDAQKALVLEGTRERRVRLHFNPEEPTRVYLLQPEEQRFLACVMPGDVRTVEFSAAGTLRIVVDVRNTGGVWMHTSETEPTFFEVPDPVIFTELAQRRHRNPELEEMMYRMQLNVERRLAQQAEEHAAHLAAIKRMSDHGRPAEQPADAPRAADESRAGKVRAPKPAGVSGSEKGGSKDGGEQPGDDGDGTTGSV